MNNKSVRIVIITDARAEVSEREVDEVMLRSQSAPSADPFEGGMRDEEPPMTDEELLESTFVDSESFPPYPVSASLNSRDTEDDGVGRPEPLVLSVLGNMYTERGALYIEYDESDIVHLGGSRTQFCFPINDPQEVTMVRTGAAQTTLQFDGGCGRRICSYNSIVPFEISVVTERIKNSVTLEKGGVLDVVYCVEMKGMPLERCHLTVNVKPLK